MAAEAVAASKCKAEMSRIVEVGFDGNKCCDCFFFYCCLMLYPFGFFYKIMEIFIMGFEFW